MSDLGNPCRAVGKQPLRGRRAMALVALLVTAATVPLALTGPSAAAEPEIPPIVTADPAMPVAGGYMLRATIYTYSLDTITTSSTAPRRPMAPTSPCPTPTLARRRSSTSPKP